MLKKLTATGILAGAATGVILLGGPAHADRLAASPKTVTYPAACYYTTPGYVPPAWCNTYLPAPVYPPTTYYPGYGGGYGHHWNRPWHHWHR